MRWAIMLGALVTVGLAQAAPPALPAGTRIQVEMKSRLDARQAQVGDAIRAVATGDVTRNGVTLLPRGSRLDGHIASVLAAKDKKSPSQIKVVFDAAQTPDGPTLALRAIIASVPSPLLDPWMAQPRQRVPSDLMGPEGNRTSMEIGDTGAGGPIVSSMIRSSDGAVVAVQKGVLSLSRGDFTLKSGARVELEVVQ